MLPADQDQRLESRLRDRFFDLHVQDPMQRIVFDRLRPQDQQSPICVAEAEQRLATAYDKIERRMAGGGEWAAGDTFSLADCAAAPVLFFAGIIVPFGSGHRALGAYFDRLLERPSFRRVLVEAQPHFDSFPFRDRLPDRFFAMADA